MPAVLRLDDHKRTRRKKGDAAPPAAAKPSPRRAPRQAKDGVLAQLNLRPVRRLTYGAAACALVYGLWVFGPLQWLADGVATGVDGQAQRLGFKLDHVQIAGADGRARADIERALALSAGQSILRLDLDTVLTRVEAVDWVQSASVMRLLPNTLYVAVEARKPYALWQHRNVVQVIDAEGKPIRVASPADHARLPLVVGDGAQAEAKTMITALAQYPRVAAQTDSLVFVGGRRWNLRLKSGADVLLPEFGGLAALAALERMDGEKALLDLPLERIDLRLDGQMAVRPKGGEDTTVPTTSHGSHVAAALPQTTPVSAQET